uniref:G-protein coupled receptors family 1 profile domain-containing protein n=1 Tax=Knipowitschia caucasica TaxID=637954 RepID=A0AAV2J9K9_KNICA
MNLCSSFRTAPNDMNPNTSILDDFLEIQGFHIAPAYRYPLFFCLLLVYSSLLLSNLGVLSLIFSDRSLHQPMFLLFCNLPINDLIGNTVLLPRLMMHIVFSP